ncbi:LysR family transcriptional regulator [Citrobacter portucalensis]|uniref:LysR family transcriptional regulator n=1 Tax=Citrobacter portucalensis TaxID=1639133 RepID=UPI00226BB0B9|nr:LysR family transcriptional regulator [Citrobacter portucalensis]MCX9039736.1 LysR family transcriptional regulator [Citrobacter portucalensis]MCX9063846.1 LysR family transcriptional regulator [Citrobacter portucalensis]
MGKLEDIILMVKVVESGSLSAAGRIMNLSPATMTSRLKSLEERYQTRLFNRSTRTIALTQPGEEFYKASIQALKEIDKAESILMYKDGVLHGNLRISAPSDFGRKYLSPALLDFIRIYPEIKVSLYLEDAIVDLITQQLDMCIRIGNLPNSSLITRTIHTNYRVLVASDKYLKGFGIPESPDELHSHRCLIIERNGVLLNEWHFDIEDQMMAIRVHPAMVCNDGALLRDWALEGAGITAKSWCDVKDDVEHGRLKVVLSEYFTGFSHKDKKLVGLQFVYPQRHLPPPQVAAFSDFFIKWLKDK